MKGESVAEAIKAGIDSRKKFENVLLSLMTEACRASDHWNLLKGINGSVEDYCQEINESNEFWLLVTRSLQDGVVVRLANLLDTQKDVVSLPKIFRILRKHAGEKSSTLGIYIDNFDATGLVSDIERVGKTNPTVVKILALRCNFLAHRATHIIANRDESLLPNLSNAEIDEVIDLLYDLAVKYCGMYGINRRSRGWSEDYRRMFELLKLGLAASKD